MPQETIYDKWQAGDRDSPALSLLEIPEKLFTSAVSSC